MNKGIKGTIGVLSVSLVLAACSSESSGNEAESSGEETISLGVLQFMEHNSLQNAQDGFIDHLEEQGYNLDISSLNAQGDQANLQQMSEQLASDSDLLLSIATPAAQSMMTVEQEQPILFTAVTDPVDAGLVNSMEEPGANATGTTDMMPVENQIDLLLQFDESATDIGIIYNASEANSEIQVQEAITAIEEAGLNPVTTSVSNTNEVQQAMESLVEDIDLLYIPTDNTLASTMPIVSQIAVENQIPVVPGAGEMVTEGGLATYGVNYYDLGKQTAEVAIEVLEGGDPASTPVQSAAEYELIVNEEVAAELGIYPESIEVSEE